MRIKLFSRFSTQALYNAKRLGKVFGIEKGKSGYQLKREAITATQNIGKRGASAINNAVSDPITGAIYAGSWNIIPGGSIGGSVLVGNKVKQVLEKVPVVGKPTLDANNVIGSVVSKVTTPVTKTAGKVIDNVDTTTGKVFSPKKRKK